MTNLEIDNNILLILSCVIFAVVILTIVLVIIKSKKGNNEIDEFSEDINDDLEEIKTIEKENTTDLKTDIEEVLEHMQENIETKPAEVVQTFENDQEEKAIISYKELVKAIKEGQTQTSLPKMNHVNFDDDEEDVKDDLESLVNKVKIPMSKDSFNKFKSSEFISPVYGKDRIVKIIKDKKEEIIEDSIIEEPIVEETNLNEYIEEFNTEKNEFNSLEQTLNLGPLTEEIQQNEDFLSALKDFREHL